MESILMKKRVIKWFHISKISQLKLHKGLFGNRSCYPEIIIKIETQIIRLNMINRLRWARVY